MNHRQPGSNPRSTPPAQTASKPRLLCGFAENYPPPAHNRKSEPMSNITPAIDESARHQARVLPFNGNHRYRPFLPASERHLHGMPDKQSAVLREIINRNPFCRNDFRAILFEWQHPWFAFIGFRTFQGLLSSSFRTFQGLLSSVSEPSRVMFTGLRAPQVFDKNILKQN